MRDDEEFRNEVFKRCVEKLKKEKAAKKKTAASLCAFVTVCCAAAVMVYGGFFNKGISESNGIPNTEIYNSEETDSAQKETTGEINIITPESGTVPGSEEYQWMDDDSPVSFCIRENGNLIINTDDPEKSKSFYNIIENAMNGGNYGGELITKGCEIKYTVTFLFYYSGGEYKERYYISGNGYIRKETEGQWQKLSETDLQKIQDFVQEKQV